jgi:hypothetical protein
MRPKCEHNKRRTDCFLCGGGGTCSHGKKKSQCRKCGGRDVCSHGKNKYYCKICAGNTCEHGNTARKCTHCRNKKAGAEGIEASDVVNLVRTFPALLEDAAARLARENTGLRTEVSELRTELESARGETARELPDYEARIELPGEQSTSVSRERWGDLHDFCFILAPSFLQQPLPLRKLPPPPPPSFKPLQWSGADDDVSSSGTRWDEKALGHAAGLLCLAGAKSELHAHAA